MNIAGHVAFITGGASGLGKATADELVRAGAKVVLFDLPRSAGEQVAADYNAQAPGTALFTPGDVTSEEDVTAAIEQAREFGDIRAVVNCAGIGSAHRIVGKDGVFPLDNFRKVLEVNLVGTFNVLRLGAAAMRAQEPIDGERGVIINTASAAAFDGQIGQSAYSASKGGVVSLTLTAARDLASGLIRVNTIAPGIFKTPLMLGAPDNVLESLGRQVPNPSRLGEPPEYALLARQIVENPYLNGETIRLDGAIRMQPK
ncbi:3-hydroxyacyl-CoA dehydrogenase [Brevibacterium sp. 91QC2O2]|uniref:3-hydroxyacyl-CoA dehydrogenase n=1 Tax=Brevibacterium sp. 91QC2O2 TaxID=2968458 RepID=UPI00211C7690|nr:3-hydroxyacyl-CoA dehydrogenase [Brevibacterium sp. 91QC2O2]MCQ9367514.1 3-hydroxyacyl-CoA dehydrogenase [Brevibacterium sp. 91QC2O2]